MNPLSIYGWTDEQDTQWHELALFELRPARVIADFGTSVKIAMPELRTAEISGKIAHHNHDAIKPKIGDWVAVRLSDYGHATVEATLPRRNEIARKTPGKQSVKQVIAANVDIAFVLLALDNDFSVERLSRFLYQLSIDAITPIIILNKADKTANVQGYIDQLQVFTLPIIVSIATQDIGIAEIMNRIPAGKTAVLLGSSGVGKSTITNKLLGEVRQKTQTIRESDEAGRHTTVHRELFVLPSGGLLIDTPGIRELQLWGTQQELDDEFEDVATLARQCKYTTCRHGSEEGCAIRQALDDGRLEPARYQSFLRMKRELGQLEERTLVLARQHNERSRRTARKQKNDSAKEMRDEMDEGYQK